MIIDDDQDLGLVLTRILKARKIYAMAVHSLSEAEACLSYLKPSVIFLDNSFPEGLGINFIQTIKLSGEDIKIIMITADSANWIEEKALTQGIHYFLRKPITIQHIDNVIEYLNW